MPAAKRRLLMVTACEGIEDLLAAVHEITADARIWHTFLHGTELQTVVLGGKETPTLRKLVSDIDERHSRIAEQVVEQANARFTVLAARMQANVDEAAALLDQVKSVTVTATTLAPDAEASADYDPATGRITLGLPKGAIGNKGEAGPTGTALIGYLDAGEPGRTIIQYIDAGEPSPEGGK